MIAQQLSFLPKFCDVNDEDYDVYSKGFAAWQQHVGQFASLLRYSAEQKVISQSWEQNAALFEAVSDDEQYKALLKIDLITDSLNHSFRNMVFGIRLAVEADRYAAQYSKRTDNLQDEIASQETEFAARIELLELRENLIEFEKEYTSEEAARRSVYWQRSEQFDDITPVLTPQQVWHGRDENSADAAVHDSRERRYIAATGTWQVGSWITNYVLSFCEKEGAAA